MAFWGIEVKPGKPITHSSEKARGRLRISQATLGIGEATKNTVVQCNVGNRTPVLLCALVPNKTESCHLDLEFEEADDVIFSVVGPRSVYLTGYYVRQNQQSNVQSDTESFGVDIENSHTEGSSYGSDDDKYEDSFIDDGELRVSPPSPVSSSKDISEATSEKDELKDRKVGRKLKKKGQVIYSDDDGRSSENKDEDGWLLSAFMKKKPVKKTMLDDAEKAAPVTVKESKKTKDDDSSVEPKEKVALNMENEQESEAMLALDGERTHLDNEKDEVPGEMATDMQAVVNDEKPATDGNARENKMETNATNQNLLMSNEKDVAKSKKKRKRRSEEETKVEVNDDIGGEEKKHDLGSKNIEISSNCSPEGSKDGHKSKKVRKEHNLKESCEKGTGLKCPEDGKCNQELLPADNVMKDLPAANGACHQKTNENISMKSDLRTDSNPEKTKKKTKKKTEVDENLRMGRPCSNTVDNKETTLIKHEDQNENMAPINGRTLSNGLMIEVLASGPPDGKVAASGKKVRIYYTGMLKENGKIFDSNVGKNVCKFRLGAREFIEGLNIGIDGMSVGEKRRLTIPPSMGFGNHGGGENVPPNSWLVYEVELVGVRR